MRTAKINKRNQNFINASPSGMKILTESLHVGYARRSRAVSNYRKTSGSPDKNKNKAYFRAENVNCTITNHCHYNLDSLVVQAFASKNDYRVFLI